MIVILAFLAGAVLGGLKARRRNGNRMDIAQYAVAFGLAFAILGLFATVAVERLF
jgi:hypothetical protein